MSDDVCDAYLHLFLPHLFGAGAPEHGAGAPGAEPHAREQEKAMALLTALPMQWREAEALEASGELPQARMAWEVNLFHVCLDVSARTSRQACMHACEVCIRPCICRNAYILPSLSVCESPWCRLAPHSSRTCCLTRIRKPPPACSSHSFRSSRSRSSSRKASGYKGA
jgi:hypothetical protein